MGNRSRLVAYLKGDNFYGKEKMFYDTYIASTGTSESKENLIRLFNSIKYVWNEDVFENYPVERYIDLPDISYIDVNNERYYTPITGYSKNKEFLFEYRDTVPALILGLYTLHDYEGDSIHEGYLCRGTKFYTTVEKAKVRLQKYKGFLEYGKDIRLLEEEINKLPEDSILELSIGEVVQDDLYINHKSLDYYLEQLQKITLLDIATAVDNIVSKQKI